MEEKSKKITIRVTEENYAKIKENAENAGLSVTEYLSFLGVNPRQIDMLAPDIFRILNAVQTENEKLYTAVQEFKERNKDSLGDFIMVRFWDAKTLEQNRKLRYIEDSLKEILSTYSTTNANPESITQK